MVSAISISPAGIAVNHAGPFAPGLIGAIQRQAATLMHVSNLYGSPQGEHLAQRLVDLTFADTVFFTNSGAEAVECAIKTARAYHSQHAGNDHKFETDHLQQRLPRPDHGDDQRVQSGKDAQGLPAAAARLRYVDFDDLEGAKAAIGPNTAGFLVEPIQGEGGIRPASKSSWKGLRALADEHDLLLALDEVQCGVARTGTFYAYEQYGIDPMSGDGQGPGRRLPDGCLPGHRKGGARHGDRHPRIDLWRQPAGDGGGRSRA
jgi:acetylornithine/N-succinyldiaminopimelate aminotransferase